MKRWTMLFAVIALTIGAALALQKAKAVASVPGKPDLIVDQKRLLQNWVVRDEKLSASACSVQEGGITPGEHKLVRFTVSTPNIGSADLVVGDPTVHFENGDGLFEFASCHRHFHFRHYSLYELIDPATGHTWRAAKRGFCMIDIEKFQEFPGPANNERNYLSCGAPATATEPAIRAIRELAWAGPILMFGSLLVSFSFWMEEMDRILFLQARTSSGSLLIRRSLQRLASRVLSRIRSVFAINFRNSITLTT
jgi:hypothetical protein